MEDNYEQNNKFETSILSFEDSDKKLINLLPLKIKDEDIENTKQNKIDIKSEPLFKINHKKITINSKIKLWTSLILIIFSLLFIPFFSIAESYLIKLDKNKIIYIINSLVSYDTLNSSALKNLFYFFYIFLNKDFLAGYVSLLYIIFHPFVAMKIMYGINFSYCILVLMQILYQSRRPSWDSITNENDQKEKNSIIICESSFSNPSIPLFTFIFCILYSAYSFRHFYARPHTHMNIILKIILSIIFLSFLITEIAFLIIYRLHYFHELVFTVCLAFIWICLLISFEKKLQKIIFDATKNFFKLRKNKIKIFVYVFLELLCGITLFNLISNQFSSYQIEDNIMKSESCSKQQKEGLSLSNSFMDLSYIFCLLGEFWGASLTLENKTQEWWYQSEKYFYSRISNREINETKKLNTCLIFIIILKGILTLIVFFGICFIFNFIPYINLTFNFMINSLKYFTLFFVCTGILPILFGFIGLNNKISNSNKRLDEILDNTNSNNLFKSSLFVKYFDKTRIPMFTGNEKIHYNQLLSNEDLDDVDEIDDNKIDNEIK